MGNNYFQFKQFKVAQENCAMKVTTDACILGAWAPIPNNATNALDIGAGTGLLSLMLAQRDNDLKIDAVELDKIAAEQAKNNFQQSPWKERLSIFEGDAVGFNYLNTYDLIITNPPFFNNSLLGPDNAKNVARHTGSLSYIDLLKIVLNRLNEKGYFVILLPMPEYLEFETLAIQYKLFVISKLCIKHRKDAPIKRVIGIFSKINTHHITDDELTIYEIGNKYTDKFTQLLAPYYLHL